MTCASGKAEKEKTQGKTDPLWSFLTGAFGKLLFHGSLQKVRGQLAGQIGNRRNPTIRKYS
jgi:hypothetical protein